MRRQENIVHYMLVSAYRKAKQLFSVKSTVNIHRNNRDDAEFLGLPKGSCKSHLLKKLIKVSTLPFFSLVLVTSSLKGEFV